MKLTNEQIETRYPKPEWTNSDGSFKDDLEIKHEQNIWLRKVVEEGHSDYRFPSTTQEEDEEEARSLFSETVDKTSALMKERSSNEKVVSGEMTTVKDMTEMDAEIVLSDGFVLTKEDIFETGRVSRDQYLYFDYGKGLYVFVNKATGSSRLMNKESAGHKMFEIFLESGVILPTNALKYVKKVTFIFDIKKPESWDDGLGLCLNEFRESTTKWPIFDKAKKDIGEIYSHAEELEEKAPHIYALLMNLHEDNSDAVDHFANWLATFMSTRSKVLTAFLYATDEGAGKGVLMTRIISRIFGAKYTTEKEAAVLASQFTEAFESMIFVNFNEVSSDFSKQDKATQRLKMFITDPTFDLNIKGIRSRDAKNNFLVMLSQNYANAIKMSHSDRRFNYFKGEKSLVKVAREKFDLDVEDMIAKIDSEVDAFVMWLGCYMYDANRAGRIFETASKKLSQAATNGASEMFFLRIKSKNTDDLKKEIDEAIDSFEYSGKIYSEAYGAAIRTLSSSSFFNGLQDSFDNNYITTNELRAMYTVLAIDGDISDRKQNKIFTDQLGDSIVKRIEGVNFRIRVLN